jgi:hypothetical protein
LDHQVRDRPLKYALALLGGVLGTFRGSCDMRRVLVAASTFIALCVPASVGLVGISSPAFAGSSLTCMKLSGDFNASITLRKCSVPLSDVKSYKAASVVVSTLASGGTFTWSKSGATTSLGPATISSLGRGRCGPYDTEQDITAAVTGGTSLLTGGGDTFSADVCVYKTTTGSMSGMTKLVKGTTASL